MSQLPIVVAVTGASGAPYAVRLLEVLARARVPVWLIVSSHGWRLLKHECAVGTLAALKTAAGGAAEWKTITSFDDTDRGAKPASGSAKNAGMVICPCSMGTLSAVAHGTSQSLVERSADVMLKERRKLILVTRETPLSLVHARNIVAVTEAGAVVMPAAPGFYHQPKAIAELVDFMVQRIVDQLGLEIDIGKRWGESGRETGDGSKRRRAKR